MLDDPVRARFLPPPPSHRTRPEMTSPWAAVALVVGAAAILGTTAAMLWTRSPNPTAWCGHGLATALLVLAAGMAMGPRRWQRRGISVAAWVMGFSLGLSLMTLWSVGFVSLLVLIFLGAALLMWPHERDEAPFGWTQVWAECLGFLAFILPWVLLLPTVK